jgi:hypothetical protein
MLLRTETPRESTRIRFMNKRVVQKGVKMCKENPSPLVQGVREKSWMHNEFRVYPRMLRPS